MNMSQQSQHVVFMKLALAEACKSPPKESNFRVGAVIVNMDTNAVVATGYTLEMSGNTHAEESALKKLAAMHNTTEAGLCSVRDLTQTERAHPPSGSGHGPGPEHAARYAIYTTMEPCSLRLSGNTPCTDRLVDQREWLRCVYYGVGEPDTFVQQNTGKSKLRAAGIDVVHVPGLEEEIITVAKAGHGPR
ncbi:Bifunctional protein RIB2 [Ceratocystis fimbriata CBS 114723]|uniref:Bifunctional protein RIB2 n=1 Tax=Ceratocystis fimbriata CBS 114723 TaxID=1035309 RepID=A0A2C5XFW5_9PEZI|nr:Bifunctional protein RIB2 [Ceratocystis fimbriata CBS 114723]